MISKAIILIVFCLTYVSLQAVTVNEIYGVWQSVSCEELNASPPVFLYRNYTFSNSSYEAYYAIHIGDCTDATIASILHGISTYTVGAFETLFGATDLNGNFTIKTQTFLSNTYGNLVIGGYLENPCWASYYPNTTAGVVYNIANVNCPSLSLIACLNGYADWLNISSSYLYTGIQGNFSNCSPGPRPPALGPPLQRPPPPTPAPTPAPTIAPAPTPAPTSSPAPTPTPKPTSKPNFGVSITPASMLSIISALLLCALF